MGFRFRKSINFGGFRINFSKSGIGYSFGTSGFRYTRKAGGGTRTTVGIPNTGLSYVHDSATHKARKSPAPLRTEKELPAEQPIEEDVIESSPNEMIDRLQRTDRLYTLLHTGRVALLIVGLLFAIFLFAIVSNGLKIPLEGGAVVDGTVWVIVSAVFAALSIAGAVVCFIYQPEISLSYDFSDEQFERRYNDFKHNISVLQDAEKIWELRDDVPREKAIVTLAPLEEPYLISDLPILAVHAFRKKIVFLPDIIAVKQPSGWVGVAYSEAAVSVREHPMDELAAPSDSKVLSQHWQHANKDGGRDKRFNENPLLYRCLYGEAELTSQNGLQLVLLCSSDEKAQAFCAALEEYIAFMKTV